MADLEIIKSGGVTYNIKDANAIPNTGNTTTDDLEIKRDFIKLANNETNESYVGITDTNGGQVFIAGQNRTHIDGGSADIDLHDYIQLRAGTGQKAYYGNPQSLTDDYEIAVKGDLTGKLDKTGGAVTGQITTNQTTFDNDQQLVTKKYVDDNAGSGSGTTVYELGMPDFSNAVDITSDLQTCHDNSTPYEIPDNGFILLKAWNGYIAMWPYNSDDNTPLAITNIGNITSYSSMYTVKKGDKYNVTDIGQQSGGNHYAYFIPVTYSDGVVETREIGTPDYDNRIQFTQADLPYTVPCDGYLYIGGWQSSVSLKYKDADNNYVGIAFASTSRAIAEYGMYPVTKGMVLEYNDISGNEAKMYIVPMEYNAMSIGRGVEELYVASGTTAPNTITLSQPYTNFDELVVSYNVDGLGYIQDTIFQTRDLNVGNQIGYTTDKSYFAYTLSSATLLGNRIGNINGFISRIYGIKYASKYAKVDDEISATSENPVQNKVVKAYVDTHSITDYTQLTNKPSINNVTLSGNKTLSDLGISEHDNYVQTVLWQNTSSSAGTVNNGTLNDLYTNYDELVLVCENKRTYGGWNQYTFDTSNIETDRIFHFEMDTTNAGFVLTDGTTFNVWSDSGTVWFNKIIGVCYGARKPYKETRLYTNPDGQRHDSITLADEVTNYDVIAIDFVYSNGEINSQKLIDVRANAILAAGTNNILNINFDIAGQINAQIYVPNSTPLIMSFAGASGYRINDVIGISYGGSVKGRNVTSLFTNSGSTNPASITLPTAYTEFDEIIVAGHEANNTAMLAEKFILSDTLKTNDYISLQSGDTYLNYLVASETGLTFANAYGLVISGIYGIKYDSDYITIDSEMSSTSENPVQNKVVKDYVDNAIAAITNYEEEVFPNA